MSSNGNFPIHLNRFTLMYMAIGAALVAIPLVSYKVGKFFSSPRINVVKTVRDKTTYVNGDDQAQ